MVKNFVIYNTESGKIRLVLSIDPAVLPYARKDMEVGEEILPEFARIPGDYVKDGRVVQRPVPAARRDGEAWVIENLPPGGELLIDGERHTIEAADTSATLTSEQPATYSIVVPEQFPWMAFETEVSFP